MSQKSYRASCNSKTAWNFDLNKTHNKFIGCVKIQCRPREIVGRYLSGKKIRFSRNLNNNSVGTYYSSLFNILNLRQNSCGINMSFCFAMHFFLRGWNFILLKVIRFRDIKLEGFLC